MTFHINASTESVCARYACTAHQALRVVAICHVLQVWQSHGVGVMLKALCRSACMIHTVAPEGL